MKVRKIALTTNRTDKNMLTCTTKEIDSIFLGTTIVNKWTNTLKKYTNI